jgi:hypothetical protein
VQALAGLGAPAVTETTVSKLVVLLDDCAPEVAEAATWALCRLGAFAAPAILSPLEERHLLHLLAGAMDKFELLSAAWAPWRTAAFVPGVHHLLKELGDGPEDGVGAFEARLAVLFGENAIPAFLVLLLGRMGDLYDTTRWEASTPTFVNLLAALLVGPVREFHLPVTMAVWRVGETAAIPTILDSLAALMSESDPRVRAWTAAAASRFGAAGATPATLGHLSAFLADPDPEVRVAAARVAGGSGIAVTDAMFGPLSALLADPVPRVRAAAAAALGDLKVVPSSILALLSDSDPEVRSVAARAVGDLGTAVDPVLLDPLAALLAAPDRAMRAAAAQAVGGLMHGGLRLFPSRRVGRNRPGERTWRARTVAELSGSVGLGTGGTGRS